MIALRDSSLRQGRNSQASRSGAAGLFAFAAQESQGEFEAFDFASPTFVDRVERSDLLLVRGVIAIWREAVVGSSGGRAGWAVRSVRDV